MPDIRAKVERALDLVQMRHLADRPASKLSGGQQQRVALARAIAFYADGGAVRRTLSNLDAKLRAEMRPPSCASCNGNSGLRPFMSRTTRRRPWPFPIASSS